MYSAKLIEYKNKVLKMAMQYKYTIATLILFMVSLNVFGPYLDGYIDDYMEDEISAKVRVNQKSLSEIREMEQQNGYDVVVDVRSEEEYESGHLEDSINIPHISIIENPNILQIKGVNKNKMVLVYCRSGRRASLVVNEMMNLGYDKNSVHYYNGSHDNLDSAFV